MTPYDKRTERRAELSMLINRLLLANDVTQREIAERCGIRSVQKVQLWCDHRSPQTPSIADIHAMPRSIAVGLLEWMSNGHGLAVADAPDAEQLDEADDLKRLANVVRECGEASATFAQALAGGLTVAEAHAILREATEAIRALSAVQQRAKAAIPAPPAGAMRGGR